MKVIGINREGYTLSDGVNPAVVLPHETVIAILNTLSNPFEDVTAEAAGNDKMALYALTDACQAARRQVAGIAWRQGVCSWSYTWQPIDHDPQVFHEQG